VAGDTLTPFSTSLVSSAGGNRARDGQGDLRRSFVKAWNGADRKPGRDRQQVAGGGYGRGSCATMRKGGNAPGAKTVGQK
jgi:hypothetical protein